MARLLNSWEKNGARLGSTSPRNHFVALRVFATNPQPLRVMKKALLFFLLLTLMAACQKEGPVAAPAAPYPQTWQLVELTGQIPGYRKTGADLPWQEAYVFRADGTFLKTRQQGDQRVEARGTFSVQNFPDGRYAVLAYAAASSLIGSCTASALTETLAYKANETLVSTWQACDGPGLIYQKVK